MSATPSSKRKRGGDSASKVPPKPTKEPVPEAPPSTNKASAKKNNKRNNVVLETVEEKEEDEEPLTPVFDGSKTVKNVGPLMTSTAEKYGELFVYKKAYEKDMVALEKKLVKWADEMNERIEEQIKAGIKAGIEEYEKKLIKTKEYDGGNLKGWKMSEVACYLVMNKLRNLNDSHSSASTDLEIEFSIHEDVLAVCLHCLAAERPPDSCLFKHCKHAVKLHRKPAKTLRLKSKCVKPGKSNTSDSAYTDLRLVLGRDYFLTK